MKMKSLRVIALLVVATAAIIAQSIKTGSIRGTVTNAVTHQFIPNVKVNLVRNGKTISSASSNQQGVVTFSSLSIGMYDLEAVCAAYDKFRLAKLNIREGKMSVMNIILNPINSKRNKDSLTTVYDLEEKNQPSILPYGCSKTKKECRLSSGNYAVKDKAYFSTPTQDFNTEAYDKIDDNEFHEAKANPLSTFSIDVDAASYSNMRRFISQGTLPPKDAVRIEEMINYFTYDYPSPKGENPFSISTEVSSCPWNTKHELIHIGLKGKEIPTENLPPSNLTFLIDVSGSMDEPNKLPLLNSKFHYLFYCWTKYIYRVPYQK